MENIKATVKSKYKKLSPLKKATQLISVILLGLASVPITYNVGREAYEELTTQNEIIDFDMFYKSVILKNKDTRDQEKLFADIMQAALNIDEIKNINSTMTIEQKQKMIENLVLNMAQAAGIRINKVRYYGEDDRYAHFLGYFMVYQEKGFIFTKNEININNTLFDGFYSNKDILTFTFHEMIHAIEHLNIKTNNNIENFYVDYYNKRAKFENGTSSYYTNGAEISAYFLTHKFESMLNEKLNLDLDYAYKGSRSVINNVLNEFIKQYGNDELSNYQNMSIGQIMLVGIETNMKRLDMDYTREEILNSYTFNIIKDSIPNEMLGLVYKDYKNNVQQVFYTNIDNKIESFNTNLDSYKTIDIEQYIKKITEEFGSMADISLSESQILSIMKNSLVDQLHFLMKAYYYNGENYSQDTKNTILQLMEENIETLNNESEKYNEIYTFYNDINTKTAKQTQKVNSVIQQSNLEP